VDPLPERTVRDAVGAPALPAGPPSGAPAERYLAIADHPVRARLHLQQRAADNLRRHVVRGVRRLLVLIGGDLAAFLAVQRVLYALRDRARLGTAAASVSAVLVPPGTFYGWQFASALLLGLLATGNYGQGHERRNPGRLFVGCALAAALPLWGTAWSRGGDLVLARYAGLTALLWIALLAERFLVDRAAAVVTPPARAAARTLFLGSAAQCLETMGQPVFQPRAGFKAVGFLDTHLPPAAGALGHLGDFAAVLQRSQADTVVLAGQIPEWRLREVADAVLAAGCELLAVPRALDVGSLEPVPVRREGQLLLELTAPRLRAEQYAVKRAIDIGGSLIGLVVLAPVFALIALLIKVDSAGPVFFRQPRVGRGGRLFPIIKFRTMRPGAEEQRADIGGRNIYRDARLFKVKGDPRVTRVGRWLRGASLDELPQLVNVLRGDMSLVGPRPPLPSEVERYEAHHYARFDVKPGITGPWQVAGRNDITEFERVIALETDYIRHWTLGADLRILGRTVPAVVGRRGAH